MKRIIIMALALALALALVGCAQPVYVPVQNTPMYHPSTLSRDPQKKLRIDLVKCLDAVDDLWELNKSLLPRLESCVDKGKDDDCVIVNYILEQRKGKEWPYSRARFCVETNTLGPAYYKGKDIYKMQLASGKRLQEYLSIYNKNHN